MNALRDTFKALARGAIVTRARDDLRPGVQMVQSGRHTIFFEGDGSRVVVLRVLHDRMDYRRHLRHSDDPDDD